MTRFDRVIQILDGAVGGPSAPVGFHGAFWRGITRNQFVTKKVFGLELVELGNGAASNLIKALKGEPPFGADLPAPSPAAEFNRMPSGRPAVPGVDIAFIQKWIDDGCPEDNGAEAPPPPLRWRKTNAPQASSRTDDIWFVSPTTGWAVNSNGNVLHTTDGGNSWSVQFRAPGSYLRCVGFANAKVGWVGALTGRQRLFQTTDGGLNWTDVKSLPADGPVAICGLSVVTDQVVFASGSNRPADPPRMMKTRDGGQTWTAWDMSMHASILIDCYFTDELHGWVVGGKANIANPIDRDRIKPVVLETADGGATWTNRLAGQEEQFPLGEWGWKIQFLNREVGFISLENFHAGAILRTDDGGATWRRLPINDAQGNANLEGIGFVDEMVGWVGGWGSANFTEGYSSATFDGGRNWQNANEIGKFINRFRFFGNPVTIGYASGDTVYKYSSEPIPSPVAAAVEASRRPLLPDAVIASSAPVEIRMEVPAATKRLTIQLWDRFGVDLGYVLDEIRPPAGQRTFCWQGEDVRGHHVGPGRYIVRMIADDVVASSIIDWQERSAPAGLTIGSSLRSRTSLRVPGERDAHTIASLMQGTPVAQRDLAWLQSALQIALQLELSTLPPYLIARWTVKNPLEPVAQSIRDIRGEEMLHFGLVCNLITSIGGTPLIADARIVPKYPGPLPGGIRPDLRIALRRFSREQAAVFMEIEYPQAGPIAFVAAPTFNSIGEFYKAMLAVFETLHPQLSTARQLDGPLGLFKIDSLEKVRQTIELINRQGEGTSASPEEQLDDLAHYYRFAEMYHGKKLIKDPATNKWSFSGAEIPIPETWPMLEIPAGGYQREDVPDLATWDQITMFDQQYSEMLRTLQMAWEHGDSQYLSQAVGEMIQMGQTGRQIIQRPKPDGSGNYGPCFRFVAN